MRGMAGLVVAGAVCVAAGAWFAYIQTPAHAAQEARHKMTFFVTSGGLPGGAHLGGLAQADAHCTDLYVGATGDKTLVWHAYLSTQARPGVPAVNARDRIGKGPWYNAAGVMVAKSVDDLHSPENNVRPETVLNELGQQGTGHGAPPDPRDQSWAFMETHPWSVRHEILTGSQPDGRAFPPEHDHTCDNWTSDEDGNSLFRARFNTAHGAEVGQPEPGESWNDHGISGGCTREALARSHGAGLFYCFAVNG